MYDSSTLPGVTIARTHPNEVCLVGRDAEGLVGTTAEAHELLSAMPNDDAEALPLLTAFAIQAERQKRVLGV